MLTRLRQLIHTNSGYFGVVFYFCHFCSYNIFAYASGGKCSFQNNIFVGVSAAIYCDLTTFVLNIRPTSSFLCFFILTLCFPNTETKIERMVFSWIKVWAVMGLICINMSRDRWVRKTVIYLRIVFPDLYSFHLRHTDWLKTFYGRR